MQLRKRRAYFAFLVFMFALLAPLLLYYSRGWRFDFKSRRIVITGSLTVTSEPSGAQVTASGIDLGRTPLKARRMEPGSYTLKIVKEGFFTRSQEIVIEPSQAVVLQRVPLFAQVNEPVVVYEGPVRFSATDPAQGNLAFVAEESGQDVLYAESVSPGEFRALSRYPLDAITEIQWSPNGEELLVTSFVNDKKTISRLTLSGQLTDLPQASDPEVRSTWISDQPLVLIFGKQYVNLGDTTITSPSRVIDIAGNQDLLYILAEDEKAGGSLLSRYSRKDLDAEPRVENVPLSPSSTLMIFSSYLVIHDSVQKRARVIDTKAQDPKPVDIEYVQFLAYSEHRDAFIIASDVDVRLYDAREGEEVVFRSSTPIRGAAWVAERDSLALIRDGYIEMLDVRIQPATATRLYESHDANQVYSTTSDQTLTLIMDESVIRYPLSTR